jgi:transcriptional regulator with XRE-family HTH domain
MQHRLKEERERVGLTQNEAAALCNVSKRAYCSYEAGSYPKTDLLMALADAGIDVIYILTGQRSQGGVTLLSPDEAALLDDYRRTPPEEKDTVRAVADAFAERAAARAKSEGETPD